MEEENQNEDISLTDRVREINDKLQKIMPEEPKGKNKGFSSFVRNVTVTGWILAFCLGGLGFLFGWLLAKSVEIGAIVGVVVFFIVCVIFNMLNMTPPFLMRRLGKRKKKQGYIVVVNIGMNKAITFEKIKIDEGVIMGKDGIPHVVKTEDIFIYKNKIPMIIQPTWSETPFSAKDHFKETAEKNEGTLGWNYIINYMAKNQLKEKKNFNMMAIIIGVLLVLGVGYYIIKSKALF